MPKVRLYDEPMPRKPSPDNSPDEDNRPDEGLSVIEERFCKLYVATYDPYRSAQRAGYSPSRAPRMGARLKRDPRIIARIDELEAERAADLKFEGNLLLARDLLVANADSSELSKLLIPPCRHCWGKDHQFQYTTAEWFYVEKAHESGARGYELSAITTEFGRELARHADAAFIAGKRHKPLDYKGGEGYDINDAPNPECPNCRGAGRRDENGTKPFVIHKDTRYLSPEARALYAGAEIGPHGFKVLMHDQGASRARLHRLAEKWFEMRGAEGDSRAGSFVMRSAPGDGPKRITKIERVVIDATPIDEDDDVAAADEAS